MDPQLIRTRQELRVLQGEIAERTKYKRQQEAIITEMIEQGNSELLALHHEILVARKELREIKTDIRTARQDKVLIGDDLTRLQAEITRVTIVHMPLANGFM